MAQFTHVKLLLFLSETVSHIAQLGLMLLILPLSLLISLHMISYAAAANVYRKGCACALLCVCVCVMLIGQSHIQHFVTSILVSFPLVMIKHSNGSNSREKGLTVAHSSKLYGYREFRDPAQEAEKNACVQFTFSILCCSGSPAQRMALSVIEMVLPTSINSKSKHHPQACPEARHLDDCDLNPDLSAPTCSLLGS